MIKNILLAYNGSRGSQVALAQAVDLARAAKARVHVTAIEALGAGEGQAALQAEVLADGPNARLPEAPVPLEDELPDPAPTAELDNVAELCRREEVFCTFNHHYGDPGQRLVQLSRLADLVVLGRRDEPRVGQVHTVGRVARYLAAHPAAPTLFSDREHLPLKSVSLLYEPRQAGGRALAVAGEVASLLNVSLNVMCIGYGEVEAVAAEEEARFALRAYHVEGRFERSGTGVTETLQNTALSWNDPLLVMAAPPRALLFTNQEAVRVALGLPNLNVLITP